MAWYWLRPVFPGTHACFKIILNTGRPEIQQPREIAPLDKIEDKILLIRCERVIIDADLANFYGVSTKRLNEQVKRNRERFPIDFMFQLSEGEKREVVANCDHLSKLKFSKALPYVFTEHGAIMAANVLNSSKAVELGVFVVRAFVNLRRGVISSQELTDKLLNLELKLVEHDHKLISIVHAIKELLGNKEIPQKRRIGFGADKSG